MLIKPSPLTNRLLLLLLTLLLGACGQAPSQLEQIRDSGVLRVATRNSPTTYYQGQTTIQGPEFDLVNLFARQLGVRPKFILYRNIGRAVEDLNKRNIDIIAAGLASSANLSPKVHFGPSYQQVRPLVIYRRGNKRARKIADLIGSDIEVIGNSHHEELLQAARQDQPQLEWRSAGDQSSEDLLFLLQNGLIDYTLVDSNELALNQRYYPEIAKAFEIGSKTDIAWGLAHRNDQSLYRAVEKFFQQIKEDGRLNQILERYYGHVDRLGYVDNITFRQHVEERLPRYRNWFRDAAEITGHDWRLLAAIGYQESHWDPQAVSPTGVRGLMMLTHAAAKDVGVEDRTDPKQSIFGGARYLRIQEKKLPKRIKRPDRTWLALAGYNVGFGHLEDARKITQSHQANPDKWAEVKQYLPLLSKPRWYNKTRYGYARGREPVIYVENIRYYYELLKWLLDSDRNQKPEPNPLWNMEMKAL